MRAVNCDDALDKDDDYHEQHDGKDSIDLAEAILGHSQCELKQNWTKK